MTQNHPKERAAQLTAVTGVPNPFLVEYYGRVPNRFIAEKCAHSRLAHYHHRKEFYKTEIGVAIYCVETISQPIEREFIKPGNIQKVLDYINKKGEAPYPAIASEWRADQEQKAINWRADQKQRVINSELLKISLEADQRKRDREKEIELKFRNTTGKSESLFNYNHPEVLFGLEKVANVQNIDHSTHLLPSELHRIEENAKQLAADLHRTKLELEKREHEVREANAALAAEKNKGFFKRLFQK